MYGREELTSYDCNEGSYDSMGFPWEYKEMVYAKDKADKVMDAMERRIARLTAIVEGWKRNSVELGKMYHKKLEDVQNTMATENVDLGMENHKLKERIKELEHQVITDCTCDSSKSATLRMDLYKAQEYIKELESKLYGNNGETTRLLNRINNFFTEDVKAKNIIEECYTCIHQLLATISKMETTTPKWISLKDRLPYSMERVLVCTTRGTFAPATYSALTNSWIEHGQLFGKITHWMQLPPPPTNKST